MYAKKNRKIQKNSEKQIGDGLCDVCPIISKDIDDFITTINTYCYHMITRDYQFGKSTIYPITRELNDMLIDIPENKDNWDRLYAGVPDLFLGATIRRQNLNDPDDCVIIVKHHTDLNSQEAKNFVKVWDEYLEEHPEKILNRPEK